MHPSQFSFCPKGYANFSVLRFICDWFCGWIFLSFKNSMTFYDSCAYVRRWHVLAQICEKSVAVLKTASSYEYCLILQSNTFYTQLNIIKIPFRSDSPRLGVYISPPYLHTLTLSISLWWRTPTGWLAERSRQSWGSLWATLVQSMRGCRIRATVTGGEMRSGEAMQGWEYERRVVGGP